MKPDTKKHALDSDDEGDSGLSYKRSRPDRASSEETFHGFSPEPPSEAGSEGA